MVRKFKFHEEKLLKKTDFINWKVDNNLHEVQVLKKFHIAKRADYTTYNKLSREVRNVAKKIAEIDSKESFRTEAGGALLEKLYLLGLISTKWNLGNAAKISASSFCRRRLAMVMVRNRMAQNLKDAIQLIEHGHVRVGTDVVKDPAFIVSRSLEDFVTWVDNSKIKKHVLEYNDLRDDFEM